MGRHSGDAYEAAPDEWRPVGGGDNGHSPVTRRTVLGILGVAGAAAACTAGVSVVANKPEDDAGTDPAGNGGAMPAGAPAKPVGLAAGAAGITAPTSDKATAKAYDKTGYRSSKPPKAAVKQPLLQRPTIVSLDPNLHLVNRVTYGVTGPAMAELQGLGRQGYLEQQLTLRPDPAIAAVADRYPLLRQTPTQLRELYRGNDDKPDNQKLDYMATEDQLVEMKIIRSVWSTNQLAEKVHDVWSAFVHVPVGDKTRLMAADYDRTVVRTHALGRFEDMLKAAIFHPAMLVYLDQPDSNGNRKEEDGRFAINENLGRECLELFSVGSLDPVTGKPNYDSRADVVQCAYALTGLTVDRETLTYRFDPGMRYRGPLKVMGWRHPNTNPAQGPAVVNSMLSYLANHPATARHVAEQFARHFVSDTPRPELIATLAAEYTKARTDIKPMLRALFASEDFQKSVGQKYRTGWEYLAATLRSTGATLDAGMEEAIDERRGTFRGIRDLRYFVEQNGGGPHGRATPDGQPDFMGAWLSGKGLLDRWNINGITAAGDWKGIKVPEPATLANKAQTQAQMISNLSLRLTGQQIQPSFTTAVHQSIGSAPTTPAAQVKDPVTVVRTILSVPHLNYS